MVIKPTQKQLDFLDWEFGVFFHFGIRSFFHGHKDWDGKPMPAAAFNPVRLDCKQWIRTIKRAGARYAILVCKHHDGFANWPSRFSDYSVAQSPWENGKGDVVKEFVEACRAYNVKIGLYYSPAQWSQSDNKAVHFDDPTEYDDYFVNQITELLSNYGKIDYLWFDGCGSENHEYDKPRIIRTIRTLQPDIRIFSMWDPETRWVGNEDGYADMPNVNTVDKADFSMFETEARQIGTTRYLPAECDMKMRTAWFDCEANADTVKTLDELIGIYEYSVGRGANLLLNIGPTADGTLPAEDTARLLELGAEIERRYGKALPFTPVKAVSETEYEITADPTDPVLADTVVIKEDIADGERVRAFKVYANLPAYRSKKICVYQGETIGHKAICRFPTVRTARLSVEIVSAEGDAKLASLEAFHTAK